MQRLLPLLALAGLMAACGPASERPEAASNEPVYLNHAPEATYVGKEVCGTCHPDKYETFTRSQMGRSFKPATLQNSAADFEKARPVYDPHNDLYYRPFHRGDSLYIMEYRLAGRDTVHKRVEKIDYIVGSGQHTNSHIREVNGYLYQMPLTWYAQDGKWDLPPKFAGGNNYRFDRPIPIQCMTCHNAMPGFVEGSENRFSHVPDGIDCERCHGPGSVHVEAMRAGRAVDVTREIDRTIVNPAKLPVERQFDVCQRCHMQGAAVWKQSPMAFRPGMRLADFENVFWPRFADSTHQFIMASHPDRLKMSACFIQTQRRPDPDRGSLTCITCHDPHVPIETLGADHYNQVCQSCHAAPKTATCTEAAAVRARAGDNCVSCHMPVSGSTDIPHVRITDHFIRAVRPGEVEILSAEEATDRRRFVRMAGLIDPNPPPEEMAEGFLTYYEEITNQPGFPDSAAAHLEKALRTKTPRELARPLVWAWFRQGRFDEIIRLARTLHPTDVPDAWTWYRIGEAFLTTGQADEAVTYLERAVERAPEHLRFLTKLGVAYHQAGRLDRALATFDAVLQANPTFAEAYNNRGFTRAMRGDVAGAEADFKAALALDPDAVMPLANLASLYFNLGRKEEARPLAERLVALDPGNPNYQSFLRLLQ